MRPALHARARAARKALSGPTPALNLDLTSTLPGQITFTRSSTAKAIVAGVFVTLSANQPAFESAQTGKQFGLRINGAATNLSPGSNQLTNPTYWTAGSMTNATVAAGTDLGPDGATVMAAMSETTGNGVHLMGQTYSGLTASETVTFSCYVRRPAGVTRQGFGMRIAPQFNNNGAQAVFRFDGATMHSPVAIDTTLTNPVTRMTDLGGGLFRCSFTATTVAAGSYTCCIHSVLETAANGCYPNVGYVGATGQGPEISSVQFSATNGPASYCDNPTTAGASVAAESAIFNDYSWFNSTAGTFVIEHDCFSGPVLGSGATAIVSGQPLNSLTGTAKTAISWDGTGSDLVNNGGATTAGATPTFTANDLRLLATSGATSFAHVRFIRFYPARYSVAQLQAWTTPTSTANPAAYRVATRAYMPNHVGTTAGTRLNFLARVPATILGNHPKLSVDFANFIFPGIAVPNGLVIDGIGLERVSGVAETVMFKFGGSTSVSIASGATHVIADDMLPSQFTSISQFTSLDDYRLRVYGHVTTTGFQYPWSRSSGEANTTFFEWDAGVTAPDQPVTATGPITFTGAHNSPTGGCAPILIGPSVSVDGKSAFILADSRGEGVSGGGGSIVGYTFIQKACDSLGIPSLIYCLGGSSQVSTAPYVALWGSYMVNYARILVDEMGTNNGNQLIQFGDAWHYARANGMDKIVHTALSPSTSGMTTTSLTSSGTTATLTIATGTLPGIGGTVVVSGATPAAYNGTFIVTASGAGAFSYTTLSAPGSNATGTVIWTDAASTTANQTVARALNSNMENLWAFAALSGQIDANDTVSSAGERDGTNPAKWAANGTPFFNTQDLLHRSLTADNAAGVALQPVLAALVMT